MSVQRAEAAFTGKTAWARNLASPVRDFLSAESGGAVALLAAVAAALIWANSPWSDSYESFWTTNGSGGISMDLREWVNSGLMTFFFLVVGLEAKRELDTGELRERQRLAIPVFASLGGMAVPILIFTAFNAGGSGARCPGAPGAAGDPASAPLAHDRSGRRPGGAGHHRDRLHGSRRPLAPGA